MSDYLTEEVREAIMRLTMCARRDCLICKYKGSPREECSDRATKCMNTIADAFRDRKRGEWIPDRKNQGGFTPGGNGMSDREICGECKEVWKDIQGLEGEYQVSNHGRVKRVKTGKILKNSVNNNGYVRVNLKRKVRLVHRLVAEAFIPNPHNYPCVNHKDENKLNPHFENLEWCTYKYNLEYNGGKDRRAKPRRLKVYSVDKSGNIEHFNSISEASVIVGKSTGNICSVLSGERKTSAGRKWFYE